MLKCTNTHVLCFDLVFMNSRSKQVYFIVMYIRYDLDIHTCFKLPRQTYFDIPIHILKNSSLIKYMFWFLVKMLRNKNGFICLIFELKYLSHVYISMQYGKNIFGNFYKF